MRNVLFIGAGAPWTGGAGYLVRQQMFLKALSGCANVHVAMFGTDLRRSAPPKSVHLTALPSPVAGRGNAIQRLLGRTWLPHPLRNADSSAARAVIRALMPEQFDAIFAYRVDFAHYAGVLGRPALLLDIDDPEHIRRRERELLVNHGKLSWRSRLAFSRLRQFERSAAAGALASFVCQPIDRQAFAEPRPHVVPNAVETPTQCPPRRVGTPIVTMIGNFNENLAGPNNDGLLWFLREVWPLVRRERPDAVFQVVGRMAESARAAMPSSADVRILGFVDDLAQVYAASSCTVAPIRYGTGTRIKILESMAQGCPVASTTKGCEGISVRSGRDILIGDDPVALAGACEELLGSASLQEDLARDGHDLVLKNYSMQHLVPKLTRLLGDILTDAAADRVRPAA